MGRKKKPAALPLGLSKPEQFRLKMSEAFPLDIIKEIWRQIPGSDFSNAKPSETPYYWWWRFIKTGEELGMGADIGNIPPENAEDAAKIRALFGDLGDDFECWWDKTGKNIFKEDYERLPLIDVHHPQSKIDIDKLDDETALIVVPLKVSRRLLEIQFNLFLDVYHPRDNLRRHKYSSADVPLHPRRRYDDIDFEFALELWKVSRKIELEMMPNRSPVKLYRLVCETLGVPERLNKQSGTLKAGVGNDNDYARRQRRLKRRAVSELAQAKELMINALLGSFPNDDTHQREKGKRKKVAKPSTNEPA